ncbi:MAG: dienelactone hydrolase family protein [Gallionella sp.]|nr:dienelactone hydrolase family protein [Gallionella sp.]
MSELLQSIVLDSGPNPQTAIIWLHGLGADGHDFEPLADELQLPCPVRYIFPDAPMRPVTINGGFVMRAWYDITEMDIAARQDDAGIRDSQTRIEALIQRETERGIPPDKIFLAGFSQGGAIALHTALHQTRPLAGVLALSTYLPLAERASGEMQPGTLNTPIFMAHGRSDTVIPQTLGQTSAAALKALGYRLDWHEYPMAHSVCAEELRDIERWLSSHMG